MRTLAPLTALAGALLLGACGSADDASTEATADTVEMPADEALTAVTDEPVEDPDATTPDEAAATAEAGADAAADAAAEVAAEAVAAADAASARSGR